MNYINTARIPDSIETQDTAPGSAMEDSLEQQEDSSTRFHVDRTLIPSAHLAEMKEDQELEGLGLTVFNQEDFEEGVLLQSSNIIEWINQTEKNHRSRLTKYVIQ